MVEGGASSSHAAGKITCFQHHPTTLTPESLSTLKDALLWDFETACPVWRLVHSCGRILPLRSPGPLCKICILSNPFQSYSFTDKGMEVFQCCYWFIIFFFKKMQSTFTFCSRFSSVVVVPLTSWEYGFPREIRVGLCIVFLCRKGG